MLNFCRKPRLKELQTGKVKYSWGQGGCCLIQAHTLHPLQCARSRGSKGLFMYKGEYFWQLFWIKYSCQPRLSNDEVV